jgi:thiamine biosynthesis lipoprotein
MGSDAHVFLWQDRDDPQAPELLLDVAVAEIDRLERLWSRFLPTSDVSRLNAAAGGPVSVAPETLAILDFCRTAVRVTEGRFDPFVLPDLIAAGYDRSFELVAASPPGALTTSDPPAGQRATDGIPTTMPLVPRSGAIRRGVDLVELDAGRSTAMIPCDTAVDLGGVAKGWTADLVAQHLVAGGALAACVNIGGDLRSAGCVPEPHGLVVGVEDPFGGPDVALLRIHEQGVATSARTRRRWLTASGCMHHLIDPSTRRPAATGVASVTAVAPSGAWAEIVAKALFLAGGPLTDRWVEVLGGAALIIDDDGATRTVGDLPELS